MMKEKYVSKLSRSEALTIFKLRTRMIHLKKISETSINMISYAHDEEKNKIWKSIYIIHTYICVYMCMYVYVYICVFICVYVYIYLYKR